ncbi:hypothetical protein ABID26_004418 [Mesorhizobium shonense]|uniref:1-acyl-sn-glycerol-3-phosphate acyltransferase n=1 Tax=Mesorhizobium shonense TaxID=1209948 RepID=A0ABV2HWK6_9HYPH
MTSFKMARNWFMAVLLWALIRLPLAFVFKRV